MNSNQYISHIYRLDLMLERCVYGALAGVVLVFIDLILHVQYSLSVLALFTHLVPKPEYTWNINPMQWLLMTWLIISPPLFLPAGFDYAELRNAYLPQSRNLHTCKSYL